MLDERLAPLFDPGAETATNQDAAEDAQRLTAERMTAEFRSPLTRHTLRRRLKPEQPADGLLFEKHQGGIQSGLF